MVSLSVNMVPKRDEVLSVSVSNDSFAIDLWHRPNVFEDLSDSITNFRVEVIENQVRVCLRNWVDFVFEIMTKDNVAKTEISSRTVRQMTYNQTIRLSSGLMDYDYVRKLVRLSYLNQVFNDVCTSVDSDRVRHDQLEFFLEAHKSLGRVSRGCEQDFRVSVVARFILIINVRTRVDCLAVSKLQVFLNSSKLFP